MITNQGLDNITYVLYSYVIKTIKQVKSEMANKRAASYEQFEAELLEKPGIRKAYEALKPKYDMISALIERRNQLQMSQTELASIVGTKQPAISRLEKGDYNTTLSTLFRVANALDLDISLEVRGEKDRIYSKVHA